MGVPNEGCSRKASCTLNLISTFSLPKLFLDSLEYHIVTE